MDIKEVITTYKWSLKTTNSLAMFHNICVLSRCLFDIVDCHHVYGLSNGKPWRQGINKKILICNGCLGEVDLFWKIIWITRFVFVYTMLCLRTSTFVPLLICKN